MAQRALEEVFATILPRMVAHARESSVPSQGLMPFGLLMYIAGLRATGVTVTRAELARRLDKSNQMFTKHVDTLVKFGLLSMTRVSGGHGTGTQWSLDLVNPCIVEALLPSPRSSTAPLWRSSTARSGPARPRTGLAQR